MGKPAGTWKAVDYGLSWFPDGKRLAYVELVAKDKVPGGNDLGAFGFHDWERIPVVHLLDVETEKKRPLHIGCRPAVAPDGKSLLTQDFKGHWRQVDVETGKSKPVEWPGSDTRDVTFVADNCVLYFAFPTQ